MLIHCILLLCHFNLLYLESFPSLAFFLGKVTLFFFFLVKAIPVAYGSFWASGGIRAAVAILHHSHGNIGSDSHL